MATTAATDMAPQGRPSSETRIGGRSPFHLAAALFIAVSMAAGFYFELPKYVLHPIAHFPPILAAHSAVFVTWMVLYLAQTLLVQTRNVQAHRALGWLGLALAVVMPPLGVMTAVVMRRFDLAAFHSLYRARDLAFLSAPLADILAFTFCAWSGIALRKHAALHGRLMFLAMASIADAGFSRLPIPGATTWFFVGDALLYAAAMAHDRLTIGHVHKVFRWAVPLIVLDQGCAVYLWLGHPRWWLTVCGALVGPG